MVQTLYMHQLVLRGSQPAVMRSTNFKVQASQGVWRAESWPPRSGGVVEAESRLDVLNLVAAYLSCSSRSEACRFLGGKGR
jgi:hypothetical protein